MKRGNRNREFRKTKKAKGQDKGVGYKAWSSNGKDERIRSYDWENENVMTNSGDEVRGERTSEGGKER